MALVSGQPCQSPACCCTCSSTWNLSSGVMAACEGCLSLAVPHAALEEQWGLVYTVCPSRSSAPSTSSFPRHVSNGAGDPSLCRRARPHSTVGKGCFAPGWGFAWRHEDIRPRLPQGCTALSKQAKHLFSLSSPEHG